MGKRTDRKLRVKKQALKTLESLTVDQLREAVGGTDIPPAATTKRTYSAPGQTYGCPPE